MQVTVPTFLPEPWANQGQSATIPDTTTETGRASWSKGFPTVTSLPLKAGGIAPNYLDFQGVLQALSAHIFFQQSGSLYTWSAALDYLAGAHVLGSDGNEYVAVAASGPDVSAGAQNPINDTSESYWLQLKYSYNDFFNALRKSWIGVPRPWRSTTLPAGHVWTNGGLVLFEDYPELEEVYDAGGFSGMLLAYDADEATIAANLGKWRPNSANPTGLFLPSLGGQFSRSWVPGQAKDAGAWEQDAIRELSGTITNVGGGHGRVPTGTGVFTSAGKVDAQEFVVQEDDLAGAVTTITFSAANAIPTGPQTVPQHTWQPFVIYLGVTA